MIRRGGESGPAIEPGRSGESLLIERVIAGADSPDRMPPPSEPGEKKAAKPVKTGQLPLLKPEIDLDLIRTPEGEWYFLEANTSPAFTFFPDRDTVGAWIARLLVSPPAAG